jgi:hypothetical protein
MWRFMVAVRTAVLVFGIAGLASLVTKLIAQSAIGGWLTPFTFAIAALLISYLIARSYWRDLFPDRMNWILLIGCLLIGGAFAIFLNQPLQTLLANAVAGKAMMKDVAFGADLTTMSLKNFKFSSAFFATALVTPLIEELINRGILFKEGQPLGQWQAAILSLVVYGLAHYATDGTQDALAVVPAAILFIGLRLWAGSFVYAAAGHVGLVIAALLK